MLRALEILKPIFPEKVELNITVVRLSDLKKQKQKVRSERRVPKKSASEVTDWLASSLARETQLTDYLLRYASLSMMLFGILNWTVSEEQCGI